MQYRGDLYPDHSPANFCLERADVRPTKGAHPVFELEAPAVETADDLPVFDWAGVEGGMMVGTLVVYGLHLVRVDANHQYRDSFEHHGSGFVQGERIEGKCAMPIALGAHPEKLAESAPLTKLLGATR